jgi:diguanylate cyclase (GGDEF)-like protein/PAS domain S-box-containing protein
LNKKLARQDQLRKAAEAQLAFAPDTKRMPLPAEKLLHELQVHQIELEMQNEELQQSQKALEESRDHYFDFYDFAPVGYLTLTREGTIDEINLTGAALLGLERKKILQQRLERYISPEDRDRFNQHLLGATKQDNKLTFEATFKRHNGPIFHAQLDCRRMIKEGRAPIVRIVLTDITERAVMQRALREKEHLLSESQRLAHIGSWSMEVDKDNIRWTDETYRIYGVTPETFVPTKENLISLIYSKDQPAMREWIRACLAGEKPDELEFRVAMQNGSIRTIRSNGDLQYAPDGTPLRIIGTAQDITEYKRVEEALREQEEFFHMIAESVDDFIAVLDLEGRRLYNNASYSRVFGNTEGMKGTDSFYEIHPDDRERIKQIFRETVESGIGQRAEFRILLEDGSIHHMESSGGLIKNNQGEPLYLVVVSHDITARKMAEEEIHSLAFYDELTKLPNRRLLNDRLVQAIASSKRSRRYGALIFLDMDNFKSLNDAYGHEVGDLLLIEVARRIAACLRETDTVARFGGDEFVVVLSELDEDKSESVKQAGNVAEKIRTSLAKPYEIKILREEIAETITVHSCTSSIGVMMFLNHEMDPKDIYTCADIAMYKAKDAGRNKIQFFETEA